MSLDFMLTEVRETEIFDLNITHNLGTMAKAAGIYTALWRPKNLGAVYGKDIITNLEIGIKRLETYPAGYKKLNPSNGWGNYDSLLRFTKEVLKACKENPNAKIKISR